MNNFLKGSKFIELLEKNIVATIKVTIIQVLCVINIHC